VRVDRVGGALNYDVTARGKKSVAIDLKKPEGTQLIKELSTKFDVLLEPFRAGLFLVILFFDIVIH
jgi:alpha-methylacyl-CoA racemase